MTKYTVRRVTVEEVEVLADMDSSALREAVTAMEGSGKYDFEHLSLRILERHLEIRRRESPPPCGVDDDGKVCDAPVARLHYKLEQRLCARHFETMKSA